MPLDGLSIWIIPENGLSRLKPTAVKWDTLSEKRTNYRSNIIF